MTIHEINEAAKASGMTYGKYVNQNEAPEIMDDILACPFCGGMPEIAGTGRVYIRCCRCGAKGKVYKYRWFDHTDYLDAEDRAVRAWNRRLG